MIILRLSARFALAYAVAVALLGCGGHGGADDKAATTTSAGAIVGSWSGTYTLASSGTGTVAAHHRGTIALVIARNPSVAADVVSGTVDDIEEGAGTVSGTLYDRASADSVIVYMFPSEHDTLHGRPSVDERGHLVGVLELDLTGVRVPVDFDLSPATGG